MNSSRPSFSFLIVKRIVGCWSFRCEIGVSKWALSTIEIRSSKYQYHALSLDSGNVASGFFFKAPHVHVGNGRLMILANPSPDRPSAHGSCFGSETFVVDNHS